MTKTPLEKVFVAKVLADLRKLPDCYARKNMAGSIGGIPDVEACINGLYFGLECKRSRSAKPTALQQFTLGKIGRAGGFARVVCPEIWESVYNEITAIIERKRHVQDQVFRGQS